MINVLMNNYQTISKTSAAVIQWVLRRKTMIGVNTIQILILVHIRDEWLQLLIKCFLEIKAISQYSTRTYIDK